jgi:tetratricopeptide (TPR) repeat protein
MEHPWSKNVDELKQLLTTDPSVLDQVKSDAGVLASRYPNDAWLLAKIGGGFDFNGHEVEACQWYAQAFEFGLESLPSESAPHFCIWYGSTLRNVGRLAESESLLRKALSLWPQFSALQFFLGLTLASQARCLEAFVTLAKLNVGEWDTTVLSYRKAVESYLSEELVPALSKPAISAVRISVQDVQESASWYAEVLGAKITLIDNGFALLNWCGANLGFAKADEKNPLSTGGHISYWQVPNLREMSLFANTLK